jgi:hypothetical protein
MIRGGGAHLKGSHREGINIALCQKMVCPRESLQETFRGHISNSFQRIAVVRVVSEGVCDPKVPETCLAILGNQDIPLNIRCVNARGDSSL